MKHAVLIWTAVLSVVSATPLYYETAGGGCPIVFVGGGSAMDSRQWDAQFDFFERDFINVPTLLLVGELDHIDLHERTRFLHEKIAGSKRVVLPDGGHTSNLENPGAFNRAAAGFLDTPGVCASH